MKYYSTFGQSALFHCLGQILPIVDQYNKGNSDFMYDSSRINSLLTNIPNYNTLQGVCEVTELILRYFSEELGNYISSSMYEENEKQSSIKSLKDFIDKFEKEGDTQCKWNI